MSDNFITGIDIGTYQVKVVVTRISKNKKPLPEIIGTGFSESRGLKNGYVMQADEVSRSVKSAVSQAEKSAGVIIKKAFLSIGGVGLEEIYSKGEIIPSRADSEVTDSDLAKVMQDSEDRITDHIPNRKILHNIPLGYHLDGHEVLGRAEGMRGTKLEVNSLFITTYEQHIDSLISVVEDTGIMVEDIMASPIAASLVLLNKMQKRVGCILINIGSETTSLIVFENDTPISLKVFPGGANDVTNDIALGLKISLEEAEKIKCGGLIGVNFSKKALEEIITHRLTSTFTLIDSHLKKIKRDGLLPAGAILTGGGANVSNITEVAKNVLSLPAKVTNLDIGKFMRSKNISWSVAYGLCVWGATYSEDNTPIGIVKHTKNNFISWFKQFIP